jgi:hypothetical protein
MKETAEEKKKTVKVQAESIKLELFGDLVKFSKKNAREILPLKKYDTLAMGLLSYPSEHRQLIYKFLCGLALSAHARRTNDQALRREIFEIKNKLFLAIANDLDNRRMLNFRFCVSKRFKVIEYCPECAKTNTEENRGVKEKVFCQNCNLDRTYYNVLSMFHKFEKGGASLYLGKELMTQVVALKLLKHVDIEHLPEQLSFEKLRFTPHNLISLDLKSVMEVSKKLLVLAAKTEAQRLAEQGPYPHPRPTPGGRPTQGRPQGRDAGYARPPRPLQSKS